MLQGSICLCLKEKGKEIGSNRGGEWKKDKEVEEEIGNTDETSREPGVQTKEGAFQCSSSGGGVGWGWAKCEPLPAGELEQQALENESLAGGV